MLDGRWLVLPRYTQPEKDVQLVLDKVQIALPSQPPPRIKASQLARPTPPEVADRLRCGEDLADALNDSEGVSRRNPSEVRKSG